MYALMDGWIQDLVGGWMDGGFHRCMKCLMGG